MMENTTIRERIFKHKAYYRFRFCEEKIVKSENADKDTLLDFLMGIYERKSLKGFDSYPRASRMKKPVIETVTIGHPLVNILHEIKDWCRSHEEVENFLMIADRKTVATEVPVWLSPLEFKLDGVMTGHIDLLRLTDKIEIWDFKPNPKKELATPQVFWYLKMLSSRLQLEFSDFRCGFFNWKEAHVLKI